MSFRKKLQKYVQGTKEASGEVYDLFQKRQKQLFRLSLMSLLLTFSALAIVGTQLFYPFHVVIGVTLYFLSFWPFLRRVYLSRDTWRKYHAYKLTTNFVKKEKKRFVLAVLFLIGVAVFLWLRPIGENPFSDMSNEEIVQLVEDDMYRSVTALDYLETSGNELIALIEKEEADVNQTENIEQVFVTFLEAVAYSESLTDVHRYFSGIPYAEWGTRVKSFLIANSLYVKKYELIHRIMMAVADDEAKKKALNQYFPALERDNIYNEMILRYFEPKTRVRLTGGYLYQRLFVTDRDLSDRSFVFLRDEAYRSYEYLRSGTLSTVTHAPEVLVDGMENKMFRVWFPIQKTVATGMGRAILSTRGKQGFITPEQARVMDEEMEPGDVMLQRRNWHLSNVGIPGFWTHAALYTGDLDKLEDYFAELFPYRGHEKLSDYLAEVNPDLYQTYLARDEFGDGVSVIEAIEPGVVVQTLPVSTNADFVVVLRPSKLSKEDKLQAIMKAWSNYGKPYDFNFDLDTRDALVCSELIYDAYLERLPEKKGLNMEITSVINGRPMFTPLDMATKYVEEHVTTDQELEFVYFLKGDEETDTATTSTESEFMESLGWSKFSFLQKRSDD